jgi:hypothetical protein
MTRSLKFFVDRLQWGEDNQECAAGKWFLPERVVNARNSLPAMLFCVFGGADADVSIAGFIVGGIVWYQRV